METLAGRPCAKTVDANAVAARMDLVNMIDDEMDAFLVDDGYARKECFDRSRKRRWREGELERYER